VRDSLIFSLVYGNFHRFDQPGLAGAIGTRLASFAAASYPAIRDVVVDFVNPGAVQRQYDRGPDPLNRGRIDRDPSLWRAATNIGWLASQFGQGTVKNQRQMARYFNSRQRYAALRYGRGRYMRPAVRFTKARPVGRRYQGFFQRWGRFATFNKLTTERKWKQTVETSTAITTTMQIYNETDPLLITAGTGPDDRTGSKICLDAFYLKCVLALANETSGVSNHQMVFWLIQDTQANGAHPAVTDIFTSTNVTTAMLNPYGYGRFKLLSKKVINLQTPGYWNGSAQVSQGVRKMAYIGWHARKGQAMTITYNDVDGELDSRTTNNILLVFGSAASSNNTTFSGTFMTRFIDCA